MFITVCLRPTLSVIPYRFPHDLLPIRGFWIDALSHIPKKYMIIEIISTTRKHFPGYGATDGLTANSK